MCIPNGQSTPRVATPLVRTPSQHGDERRSHRNFRTTTTCHPASRTRLFPHSGDGGIPGLNTMQIHPELALQVLLKIFQRATMKHQRD